MRLPHWIGLVAVVSLMACSKPSDENNNEKVDEQGDTGGEADAADGAGDGAAADDAPWILPDDGAVETFELDLGALAAQLAAANRRIAGVSARPLGAAVVATWGAAEAGCPDWFTGEDGADYWVDVCTTSGGDHFDGYGGIVLYEDYDDGAQIWDGFGISSVGAVETAAGERFTSTGYSAYLEGWDRSGNRVAYSALTAGTQWTGAAEAWLADGSAPDLSFYAVGDPEGRGGAISLTAQVGGEDSFTAVIFDELLFVSEGWGSGCAIEPSGGLTAFVAEGVWVDVAFDGAGWDGAVDGARCDGCGAVSLDGSPLGEVCVDFDALRQLDAWSLWTSAAR
jgi:hypothetical protein